MGKKALSVTVRGKHKVWSFTTFADPAYLSEWREDGLEIDEIVNVIPVWVADAGLVRPWCFCQDVFHLRWPFERRKASR